MKKFMEEKPNTLLQVNNAKTRKGEKRGYLTGVLYLFPYKAFGFNICANADNADCWQVCLNTSGRGRFDSIQEARLRKTKLFHFEREWFMRQLIRDIEALIRKAEREGKIPVVRLNGTSDINWEDIRIDGRSLMEIFSTTRFYDYTKIPRVPKNSNYHLTFSYSADPRYKKSIAKAKRLGMTMAGVFDEEFPAEFLGMPVVNGDADDLRFLDPDGVFVGLSAKGEAKGSDSNLIVRVAA